MSHYTEDQIYDIEDDNKSSHSAQSAPNPNYPKEHHSRAHKQRRSKQKHYKVTEHTPHRTSHSTHNNHSHHSHNSHKPSKSRSSHKAQTQNNHLSLADTYTVSYNEEPSDHRRRKQRAFRTAEGAYSKLSKQERREFRMAFRLFDKDDDGQISVYELKQVFDGLNYHFTEGQLINMLKSIDDNGDGKVDIDEFVCVMKGSAYSNVENSRPYVEELREAFEVFDKDGDGQITPQELAAIMSALGEKLSEKDILTMIQEADADGDGNIDFEEFKKLMDEDMILGGRIQNVNSASSNDKSGPILPIIEDGKDENVSEDVSGNKYKESNNNNNVRQSKENRSQKKKRKKKRPKEY